MAGFCGNLCVWINVVENGELGVAELECRVGTYTCICILRVENCKFKQEYLTWIVNTTTRECQQQVRTKTGQGFNCRS